MFELVVPCSLLYILTAVEFSFHPSPRVFSPANLEPLSLALVATAVASKHCGTMR